MENLLATDADFDAVFAQNDQIAVGCLKALQKAGKNVPRDVLLVGYNDIPLCDYLEPALTTIHVPAFRLGRRCAEVLIQQINQSEPSDRRGGSEKMNPQLEIRESASE